MNVEASTIVQPAKNCGPNEAAAAAVAAAPPLDVVATVTATVKMMANAVANVLAMLSAAVRFGWSESGLGYGLRLGVPV